MSAVAVVLGAETGGLGVIRSLGEMGVPVWAVDFYPSAPGFRSRYTSEKLICPDPSSAPEECVERLRMRIARLGTPPVIFATTDPYVRALGEHGGDLVSRSVHPTAAVIHAIVDKRSQYRIAREAGIVMPGTWWLDEATDVGRLAEEIPYPSILKPAFSNWFVKRFGVKAVPVESAREFREACERFRHPAHPVLAQEVIPGGVGNLFGVVALVRRDGTLWAAVCARKIEQDPLDFGVGTVRMSVPGADLLPQASKVLEAFRYTGLCHIEFKRDARDGQLKFIELNPRTPNWSVFPTRCGVNLPWLAYLEATGQPLPGPRFEYQTGRIWVYPELRLESAGRIAMPAGTPRRWPWARGYVQALASARDPLPGLVFLLRMVVRWLRRAWRSDPR